MMVTFKDIATHSQMIDENDFFSHFHDPDALFRYDSNFFELKYSPTMEEFELIETMQLVFSEEHDLPHVKFYWPENQGIHPDTLAYLDQNTYGLEKLELYALPPADYALPDSDPEIDVRVVTEDTLETFKAINYIEDKTIAVSFAEAKQPFYDRLFDDDLVTFLLAFYDGQPAGSCILIESSAGLELDDLFTLEAYRKKGVATALMGHIAAEALSKQTIVYLVADAEDSPKDMYVKAGFTYEGFRIGAQKVFKGED